MGRRIQQLIARVRILVEDCGGTGFTNRLIGIVFQGQTVHGNLVHQQQAGAGNADRAGAFQGCNGVKARYQQLQLVHGGLNHRILDILQCDGAACLRYGCPLAIRLLLNGHLAHRHFGDLLRLLGRGHHLDHILRKDISLLIHRLGRGYDILLR